MAEKRTEQTPDRWEQAREGKKIACDYSSYQQKKRRKSAVIKLFFSSKF